MKASDVVSKSKDGPWRPLKKQTAEPHDVFLSHSSKDKEVADAVCATLEGRGIRCWVAPRDIPAGANWGESIIDGITVTKVMVVILSSDSNESGHVMREIERAVNKDSAIIPLKIKDIPLSKSLEYFLSTAHWLDATTPPLQGHLDNLANRIEQLLAGEGKSLARPPAAETPPSLLPSNQAAVCAITVKRKWQIAHAGYRYKILIDGKVTGKVHTGQETTFTVSPGEHQIEVKYLFQKSESVSFVTEASTKKFECGHLALDATLGLLDAYRGQAQLFVVPSED
ncbi:MAG: toll/interleukin-1 receptor domain-containing protein [Pirellulaceae bacterium]